jgi:transposase
MSTSILYHGWGLRGYHYVRTDYPQGQIIFTVQPAPGTLACPACGCRKLIHHGGTERIWRQVPIGSKPIFIRMSIPRVECRECETIRQVEVGFAASRHTYTRQFERYALELSRHMTILDVARHLNVGWDLIKDIQKRLLKRRFARPKLGKLRQIAIDEISIGEGQKYLTVVLDLNSGAVVFVGQGNGTDALVPFWRRLKRTKACVEAVAMDMSKAYIRAVRDHLASATIVFDHFHVIKLFNDKFQEFRRQLFHKASSELEQRVLKGTRWLLLKNPENLVEARNERQRLQRALELNQPLATVYYMKEDLRQLWSQKNRKRAARFLCDWIARARVSGIHMLKKFAKTLQSHFDGILAYYTYPISTGPLEGTNNKIKTMKRQAYGYRDTEFFMLKILGLHLTKYALVG